MAKYEEKFIVINNKHINKLPLHEKDEFIQALVKIRKLIPEDFTLGTVRISSVIF